LLVADRQSEWNKVAAGAGHVESVWFCTWSVVEFQPKKSDYLVQLFLFNLSRMRLLCVTFLNNSCNNYL
jgi:hypothetical protein